MEQEEIDAFIDDPLAKGYICPSTSDQTLGVFFIPKKDGKKRMVQDYRYINSKTLKNNYLLPLILELIDKIGDAKIFTKMDLWWDYNNVQIWEGDEGKAAFTCHRGTYEPLVMFFGLCNSPATFQTMMNDIFHDMPAIIVYINDILICYNFPLSDTYALTILLILFDTSMTDMNLILTKTDCADCALHYIAYPYL